MRYLFRPIRENPDSLATIPFHLNRSLSKDEFKACAAQYSWARRTEYLARVISSQQGQRPQRPKPKQWPDLHGLGLSQAEFWKYEIAIRQLYFAETKQQQQQATERIKALAKQGPNKVREALANARSSMPQAKRTLSGRQRFDLFDYRAKRQFLWIFLRAESQWGKGELKKIKESDDAVQTLALNYSYLGELKGFDDFTSATITDKIAKGLRDPHQADTDAATHFTHVKHLKISASSVRSLLSESLHR